MENRVSIYNRTTKKNRLVKVIKRDYELYLLTFPAIVFFIIFHYMPMYGVQIAFKDFIAVEGIMGSPWVGFKHFERLFNSYQFWILIKNTIGISLYEMIAGFPLPIILALLLNQTRSLKYKKIVQTVTYAPHFISVVVLCGMIHVFLSLRTGMVNYVIRFLGGEAIFFMGESSWFKSIFVWSGIWQNTGWGTIIYLAALSGINIELYEAAKVDGASKWQTIRNIDIPSIMPVAIILLIMKFGRMMEVGFQKAYLLQTPLNMDSSEIIATYVYKVGLIQSQYSYSTAIGLFNTMINIILLVTVNNISRKISETSLW